MNKDKVNEERITKARYEGDKRPAILCDVDGTVALMMGKRSPFEYEKAMEDRPNYPVIDAVFAVKNMLENKLTGNESPFVEVHLIMLSARENKALKNNDDNDYGFYTTYELTKAWLDTFMKNDLNGTYHQLIMREAGDYRKDCYVKYDIYKECIEPDYDVKYVFDDRNQVVDMWRNACKLTCLQVADGNF